MDSLKDVRYKNHLAQEVTTTTDLKDMTGRRGSIIHSCLFPKHLILAALGFHTLNEIDFNVNHWF